MDSSLVWGRNEMDFTIENTLNRSIGPSSQTVFQAGGFDYTQTVFNFGGTRSFENASLASDLYLAAGLEARTEQYRIHAGEPNSWRNGGALLAGAPTASGAQVFPGFRPVNAIDADRHAVGLYVDLEANVTEQWLASAALRAEDYSDFGSTVTGKLASRYDFSEAFALRGRCRTASVRPRCSSSSSPPRRRTSSLACPSTSPPSRLPTRSRARSARVRWKPRSH